MSNEEKLEQTEAVETNETAEAVETEEVAEEAHEEFEDAAREKGIPLDKDHVDEMNQLWYEIKRDEKND